MGSGQASLRPDGLAEAIARLRRALRRGARVADPGNTLAVAQLELLAALAEHPGARPGQLARLLNMRPNTVTTIVNALSARGMLCRVTAEDDRRAVELTATEAGRQAVLAWQATNAAVLNLALSTLPARQRRALGAAVPALHALAREVDRLADSPITPAEPDLFCDRTINSSITEAGGSDGARGNQRATAGPAASDQDAAAVRPWSHRAAERHR